jgi:hypothetical protein
VLRFKIRYQGLSMGASTGKLYYMIGNSNPIIKYHAVDKICILISLLEYALMQLIMGILERFTQRKSTITLFFILTTWVLLCDGQCLDDAAFPFQSLAGCGNTVLGITSRDGGPVGLSLLGHYRPECPLPEGDLLCKDGLYLGFSPLHICVGLPYSCVFVLPSQDDLFDCIKMSSSSENPRNDAVTGVELGRTFMRSSVKSVIKALSETRFGTPTVEGNIGAENTDLELAREYYISKYPNELPPGDFEIDVSRGIDPDLERNDQEKRSETAIRDVRNEEEDSVTPPTDRRDTRPEGGSIVAGNIKSEENFGPEILHFLAQRYVHFPEILLTLLIQQCDYLLGVGALLFVSLMRIRVSRGLSRTDMGTIPMCLGRTL